MKQLSLFESSLIPIPVAIKNEWRLYIDGASRKNPGPAGAGVYLTRNNVAILAQGYFLGEKTNNQAEYLALVLGVYFAKKHMIGNDTLLIISDSELLVRQLKGVYKIKDATLQQLHACFRALMGSCSFKVQHVLRAYNTVADKLANEGIDKKNPVPLDFATLCPLLL